MRITGADVGNANEIRRMRRLNPLRRFARWVVRLLLRVGLLPASAKTDTDTMGEWKRLQAEKDDPPPGLRRPPEGPHAELINRVRLYAQNGAKALAPLLDRGLPLVDAEIDWDEASLEEMESYKRRPVDMRAAAEFLASADAAAATARDFEAMRITNELMGKAGDELAEALRAIHAAYNAPWTVVNGEVYEVVTERTRPEVLQ